MESGGGPSQAEDSCVQKPRYLKHETFEAHKCWNHVAEKRHLVFKVCDWTCNQYNRKK